MHNEPYSRRHTLLGAAAAAVSVAAASLNANAAAAAAPAQEKQASAGPAGPQISEPPKEQVLADGPVPPGPSLQRDPDTAEDWRKLRDKMEREFPLTSDGRFSGGLAPPLRQIHSGFTFAEEAGDEDFNYLHVESLLDQASDLLDRGIRERAMWDDLAARAVTNELQLQEFFDLDAIHLREEQAGMYEVPWHQSRAEETAGVTNAQQAKYLSDRTQAILDFFFKQDKIVEQSGAAQRSAWVSGLPAYYLKDQEFAGLGQATFNSQTKSIADHLYDSAVEQSYYSLFLSQADYIQRRWMHWYDENSENARNRGWAARRAWDGSNISFQRERTLAARRLQEIRASATFSDDGLLNLRKRLGSMQERFFRDFRDALARLRAVERGMQAVYNYRDALPTNESSPTYFDDCLLWARRSTQWLVRFSGVDQHMGYPVSVRDRVGREWKTGLKEGRWHFSLPEKAFADMYFVRMRGVSVFASTRNDTKHIWRVGVQPPALGGVRYSADQTSVIDQAHVPRCLSGRVAGRSARREPDVVGGQSLHNASPIGNWLVQILGSVPGNCDRNCIEDVVLDMHVAFRQAPANRKAVM